MTRKANTPPAGFSRGSFFFFIMLAPAGIAFILAIIMVTQFKQFKASVSPIPDVAEFAWTDSAHVRLDNILSHVRAFSSKQRDSLWIDAEDLTVLLSSSPVAAPQGMRFIVSAQDSLLVVRSTQPVQSMHGSLSWIFKKIAHTGYLNARIEGRPELTEGKLLFTPENGYLNGIKVPSVALTKRGGMSPGDFIQDQAAYGEFLHAVGGVKLIHGKILFLHP